MLSLKNIRKNYKMGDTVVEALRGVSVDFRDNEFVAVLGPSGCGKTTLLNIIGGLDRYTEGDLVIGGVSTKKYRDRDWDTYRNHKIGFVFQSYNLIPHQNVLSNVELALTLSGVSKSERRRRAIEVLEKVGLKDQMKKKPNQMSGGQMQRVAIARALINDPDILLADEPTGALDSETSIQIMEILKEIAKDKLIIMVTHNPDLAEEYSNRIIRLIDGKITGDSNPYTEEQPLKDKPEKVRKTSMSFFTALSLSLNNLLTKKGRTILTSFAGSIGIIGIALILSLSNGVQVYINNIQRDTLASYPLTIDESSTDMTAMLSSSRNVAQERYGDAENMPKDRIITDDRMYTLFDMMYAQTNTNDLKSFKTFLDGNDEIKGLVSNIEYSYGMKPYGYRRMDDDTIKQVNPNTVLDEVGFSSVAGIFALTSQVSSSSSDVDVFTEITDDPAMFDTRYEIVAGKKPEGSNEAVLIIDKYNMITDFTLYALGMRDSSEMRATIRDMMQKKDRDDVAKIEKGSDYAFEDFIGMTFSVIPNSDLYRKNDDGVWEDMTSDSAYMTDAYDNKGIELKIVGILRQKELSTSVSGLIGYTRELTSRLSERINSSDIVKDQKQTEDYDVFNGLPFENTDAADKALEEAKREAEEKQRELEEMQRKVEEAKAQSEKLKQKMQELQEKMQQMQAQMPDMATIMTSLTAEQRLSLMMMSQEEQQEYFRENITQFIPGFEMPDLTEIISLLPEEMQSELEGKTDMQKLEYISKMFMTDPTLTTAAASPESADAFDPDNFDISSIDMNNITDEQMSYFMNMSDAEREALMKSFGTAARSSDIISISSYFENMKKLGVIDLDVPSAIAIFPTDFASKERIAEIIKEYNDAQDDDHKITYTDLVGMLMSSVTDIINAISYILIAFVAISLIVSSIMIGIITYISVLERTKEIGILRSIGASKKDVSRVFNAETTIIGLISGGLGILVTVLLIIPINIIIKEITDVSDLAALPPLAGLALVGISVLLTLIAGLLPSRVAAKKDPVVALRTE
ncbi:MAG: ATP-binding cassette domain-containing protein [Ruminiclostridium sp.]|nr:ATP-binding cassette domain-containing protein [Ruminiclostridium sp.]